jgi:hypothetical protein
MGKNECERWFEQITLPGPASPELEAHLHTCSECANLRQTVVQTSEAPSLFSPDQKHRLKSKIMAQIVKEGATSEPTPAKPGISGLPSLGLPLLLAFALILSGIVYVGNRGPQPAGKSPETVSNPEAQTETGILVIQGKPAASVALNQVFHLPPEPFSLKWGAGHEISGTGPALLTITASGVVISHGNLRIRCSNSPGGLIIQTPLGAVTTMQAEILAHITPAKSSIRLESGVARFESPDGKPRPIVVGESIETSFPNALPHAPAAASSSTNAETGPGQ